MGVLEFLVPFYPINTARVVFCSDLKMDPLNLYPTYRSSSTGSVLENILTVELGVYFTVHSQ